MSSVANERQQHTATAYGNGIRQALGMCWCHDEGDPDHEDSTSSRFGTSPIRACQSALVLDEIQRQPRSGLSDMPQTLFHASGLSDSIAHTKVLCKLSQDLTCRTQRDSKPFESEKTPSARHTMASEPITTKPDST